MKIESSGIPAILLSIAGGVAIILWVTSQTSIFYSYNSSNLILAFMGLGFIVAILYIATGRKTNDRFKARIGRR